MRDCPFAVIFTNDTIPHKGKMNLLYFRLLLRREKKKRKGGKMDSNGLLPSSSKRQILWSKAFLIRNQL